MPDYLVALPPYVSGLLDGTGNYDVGTGEAGVGGVENIIEYDGYQINKRDQVDAVLVTQIDGLADADIRDTREVNPGYDGERAFNSYYGGRTIVLSGKIRAGTLNKMRDLQEGLKGIFSVLQEKSLVFRFPSDPTRDIYINCRKSQPIVMTEIQNNWNFEREFQITLRASDPRFFSVSERVTSQDFFVDDNYSSDPQASLFGGSGYGNSWFYVNLIEDTNDVTGQLARIAKDTSVFPVWNSQGYLTFPSSSEYIFYYHTSVKSAQFSAIEKITLGATKQGKYQIGKRISSTSYIVGGVDFDTNVLYWQYKPSGSSVVTGGTASWTGSANTAYWVKTTLLSNTINVSVYNIDPDTVGATPLASIAPGTIPANMLTEFGDTSDGFPVVRVSNASSTTHFDEFSFLPVGILNSSPINVINYGTFTDSPKIKISGDINALSAGSEALRFTNINNQPEVQDYNTFVLNAKNGSISAVTGENYIEIDCFNHTMTEWVSGILASNAFDQLSTNSEWIKLVGGINPFVIELQQPSKVTLEFTHRDTYI